MTEETNQTEIDIGDLVVDSDDNDPDAAVVVNLPSVPAAEWEIPNLGKSLAEANPEYPDDDGVAVVVFGAVTLREWDGEEPIPLGGFNPGLYSFPVSRLHRVGTLGEEDDEQEASDRAPAPEPEPPEALLQLAERLESNGATVTAERGGLVVEKLGDEYRVAPSGKVEGDGPLAENLAAVATKHLADG